MSSKSTFHLFLACFAFERERRGGGSDAGIVKKIEMLPYFLTSSVSTLNPKKA